MANRLMKLNILFFSLLSLILFSVSVKATEVQEQHTAASRLEVKFRDSDLLDEDGIASGWKNTKARLWLSVRNTWRILP